MPLLVNGLDPGVRPAVVQLNTIEGVTTRASCEGAGDTRVHTHSDLAYVAFEYPLPIGFEDFLVDELKMTGRVEEDAIYSRWPQANREFLEAVLLAAKRYRARQRRQRRVVSRCRLSKLRSRLATRLAGGRTVIVSICWSCKALLVRPHRCDGQTRALLQWPAGAVRKWFAEFVAQPENKLDAGLVAKVGIAELERRARLGDFGVRFQRRWARHRAEAIHTRLIRDLRAGVADIRRTGADVDVTFDTDYARISWSRRWARVASADRGGTLPVL